MFVCFCGVPVYHPTWEYFTHMETSPAANFDLCLALMANEHWGFFNVPHLLWHGLALYNGHLQGPMTHTCCQAFGCGAVTSSFMTRVCRDQGSNHDLPHARRSLYLYATATVIKARFFCTALKKFNTYMT